MNRYKLSKAGVNTEEGIRRLNGDEKLYERLLVRFCGGSYYDRLCRNVNENKVKEAFEDAHGMKGVAGNLSCTRLYEALIPLVEELRSGSMVHARELLEPVKEAYDLLEKTIKE